MVQSVWSEIPERPDNSIDLLTYLSCNKMVRDGLLYGSSRVWLLDLSCIECLWTWKCSSQYPFPCSMAIDWKKFPTNVIFPLSQSSACSRYFQTRAIIIAVEEISKKSWLEDLRFYQKATFESRIPNSLSCSKWSVLVILSAVFVTQLLRLARLGLKPWCRMRYLRY